MFHPQGPTFFELARQALSSTERGYDLLAPKFDYTPFRTPSWVLEQTAPHVGPPNSVGSALDVCCGTGAAMQMLRPLCRDRVTGIDMSQGMLEVGREKTAGAPGQAKLEFTRGDVLDMPFEEEFDVAVCFGACGHILPRDEARFIEQVRNALRPGGRFIFATSYLPRKLSATYWLARGFNAAMHVRNLLIRPPFIMYYLTFLLPGARRMLEEHDFSVEVKEDAFAPTAPQLKLVVATRN
ncbi:MAG: class I SAM-dependent methyltransferase [Planctomycetes bacterium]|nr:class I SAM-dependent methyltransferase [Planctomycetota bacterium]